MKIDTCIPTELPHDETRIMRFPPSVQVLIDTEHKMAKIHKPRSPKIPKNVLKVSFLSTVMMGIGLSAGINFAYADAKSIETKNIFFSEIIEKDQNSNYFFKADEDKIKSSKQTKVSHTYELNQNYKTESLLTTFRKQFLEFFGKTEKAENVVPLKIILTEKYNKMNKKQKDLFMGAILVVVVALFSIIKHILNRVGGIPVSDTDRRPMWIQEIDSGVGSPRPGEWNSNDYSD
ncbi:hypothetical protein KO317_02135 [Candidatus Micrarchaeota archaeon]|jgi:hypothetical protein|nr:hypothetical protein [Candidatus Micrarchaeota archaeon]